LGGDDYFTRLIAAFYRRVPGDEVLSAMYPADDMAGAQERLREFCIQRFGGPQTYSQKRGHPRLRMRHIHFDIDVTARNRWMKLMTEAIEEVQTPQPMRDLLERTFAHMATFMMNRD
jgi:hemoglobin